jgi:hypothetical protein
MISFVALAGVLCLALVMAGAGLFALIGPAGARAMIGRFATSQKINMLEQLWRSLAGLALILRAPASLTPEVFQLAGWVIVATAAILLVIPLKWHAAYATWWSANLPLPAVRLAGVASLALAAGLAWSALG